MNTRHLMIGIIIALCVPTMAWAMPGFTGSWEAEIGISPQSSDPFHSFQATLDVGLRLSFLKISSISDFLFDGWLWQQFALDADLSVVQFHGQILFEPKDGVFVYAQGTLMVHLGMVTLAAHAAMTGATQTDSANYGWVLSISGDIVPGAVRFESNTFLGADRSGITFSAPTVTSGDPLILKTFLTDPTIDTPPPLFSGQEFIFDACLFGAAELRSVTSFGKLGFERQQIDVKLMRLLGLPLNMSFAFTYTLQTKSYAFTPSLETEFGCLSIYTHLLREGNAITGVEVYGIAFRFAVGGAEFTSISNLNTAEYVITTPAFGLIVEPEAVALAKGHLYYPQEYWQMIGLDVDIPPYGSGFSFTLHTFFSTSTGLLFDWSESSMRVTLALGTSVSVSSAITIDTTGFTEWALSARVSW